MYKCPNCERTSAKQLMFCTSCKTYDAFVEITEDTGAGNLVGTKSKGEASASTPASNIRDIEIESHRHQSTGIGELDRVLGGGLVPGGVILLAGPPGVGKALHIDTPILSKIDHNLDFVPIKKLRVGDEVFTPSGNPTKVVAITQVWENRPSYKLTFSDGSTEIADENHEWETSTLYGDSQNPTIRTTKEIAYSLGMVHQIRNTQPIKHNSDKKSNKSVSYAPKLHGLLNMDPMLSFKEPAFSLSHLINEDLDTKEKFIKSLLEVEKLEEEFDFSLSSKRIAKEIKLIIVSLGYQVQTYEHLKAVYFKVSSKPRHIVSATPMRANTLCIEVEDQDHLFLAGENLIPTHNSSILATVSGILSRKETVLYVSGEESVGQIKLRHERMNALGENLYVVNESNLSKVIWHIENTQPKMLIVDSLQTIASPHIESRAGSASQVVETANVITTIAKQKGIPTIFVGHYTKDGNVAGPLVVEHLVDVVLSFEGSEDSPLRLLRGIKNRFGAADEIGCFEHTENGLEEVSDPSGLLLDRHEESAKGVATSVYLEGKRAMPIEVQALVVSSPLPNPRKVTTGLDSGRNMQLFAILEKHGGSRLSNKDVYVSTVGNIRIKDSGVDLATAFALVSDEQGLPYRHDAVAIGEIALSGRVRKVQGINRRLSEAIKLGYNLAYVPEGTKENLPTSLKGKITLIEIKTVRQIGSILQGVQAAIDANQLK